MRVIPALDLRRGLAVHAVAGRREAYAPVRSRLATGAGDGLALARAFRDRLGLAEWYVADLDAIAGEALQAPLLASLAELGGRLLVDAGVASVARARETIAAGAARVVVGLETLPGFDALADVVRALEAERVVFGLDLRAGVPLLAAGARHADPPLALVERARAAGVGAVLVLDVARVGTGGGVDTALVAEIRRRHPGLELLAGGGVRGPADLAALAEAGCDGAVVATALHEGRLGQAQGTDSR